MGKSMVTIEHINTALDFLAEGKSLVATAKYLDLKPTTLYDAIQRDPKTAERYARALEVQAEVEVDEIKELADDETKDPKSVRNMIEARKWRASKRSQRRYGDRLDLNVNQTVDIKGAIDEARARKTAALRPVSDQHGTVYVVIPTESTTNDTGSSDKESAGELPEPDIFR